MTSPVIGPKRNLVQNIKSKDAETEFSAEIVAQYVNVQCRKSDHHIGSSNVKLTNRVNYNWEFRYNHGNLVAAHINGKIFAYGMTGKEGGMVRVANLEYDKKKIIKNLKDVKDLSFAYIRNEVILGIVDSEGNILIYKINEDHQDITCDLLLHIYHNEVENRSKVNYRLIWCPYNPDPDADDNESASEESEKMFVVLNGTKAEVVHTTIMSKKYGKGPLDPDESYDGYIEINSQAEIVDACFAVDGTAIAIASTNGVVKFFQIYMVDNEKATCLHEWTPHGDKPLSSITFIDSILEYSQECWKFTVTGANHNSEIKLWSCETWTCLQTIHFTPDPTCSISNLYFNISVDYTRQYIVMSDVNNSVLYVLQLKRNNEEQMVYVTALSQFLLSNSFLSYHILEANSRTLPYSYGNTTDDMFPDEREDFEDDIHPLVNVVHLRMIVIQKQKLQDCNIIFQPETLMINANSSLTDVKEAELVEKMNNELNSSNSYLQNKSQLNLMTPEDFTAKDNSGANSERNSLTNDVNVDDDIIDKFDESGVENLIDFQRTPKEVFVSGGSSPSREVQEILSLNNSTYSPQDYFDNLSKMKDEPEQPQKEFNNVSESLIYEVGNEMVWPKIPVVQDNEIVKDVNEINGVDKLHIQSINFRINSLENTIREQNILMQKLHNDIKDLTQNDRKSNVNKDEFTRELDCALSKHQLQIAKLLENLHNMQKNTNEQIISSIGQLLKNVLSENIQMIISHEMKHVVVPAIRSMMDSYKHQNDAQYLQKLNNAEMTLKENIAKALNSKALAESLSVSVVSMVAPSLEKCYKDIISSTVIPSWERICGIMFQQMNETFTKGTKEYTQSVESYMDRQRRVQEKGKDFITQMQSISENMKTNSDKLTHTLTSEIHKQFNIVVKNMEDKLALSIRDVVSEQVKEGFRNHASVIEDSVMNAVRSRAVTPSPHVDTRVLTSQIRQHLIKGNYSDAFQLVLSAANLAMLISLCEKVDEKKLFGDGCSLPQNCILSLIQQLSVDLHESTELKLRYIKSALLALQADDLNTKQFLPIVLKNLLKQLTMLVQSSPPKNATEAKVLIMVVENIIGKSSHHVI